MKNIKILSIAFIALIFILIIVLSLLDTQPVYENPLLLFILNIFIISIAFLVISVVCATTFIRTGNLAVICIGIGGVILAIGKGLTTGLYHYDIFGINRSVTIFNALNMAAAFILFIAAILVLINIPHVKYRPSRIFLFLFLYIGTLVSIGLFFFIVIEGMLTVFFIPGFGGTTARQGVLAITVLFFLLTGSMFLRIYFRSRTTPVFMYSVSMFLFALGSAAFAFQKNLGTPINWLGRFSQTAGGIFLLFFILSIIFDQKKPRDKFLEVFEIYFQNNYEIVFENISDAIVIIDSKGNYLTYNNAFPSYYRFNDRSDCPKSIKEMNQYLEKYRIDGTLLSLDQWCLSKALRGEVGINREFILKRKDLDIRWYGSYSFSPLFYNDRIIGAVQSARDITKQKEAEKKILNLARIISESPNPVFRVDNELKLIYSNEPGTKLLKKMGLKEDLSIPKKLAHHIMDFKHQDVKYPVLRVGSLIYEFTINKVRESGIYNIYARDVTEKKRIEKIRLKAYQSKISELERKKIARELHDSVSQILFSSKLLSESISKTWAKDPQATLESIKTIESLNTTALLEIRLLLGDLMPENISQDDIVTLLRRILDSTEDLYKINTKLEVEGQFKISDKVKNEVYRIAQEAINNVVKHSNAENLNIRLDSTPNELKLIISDDGSGFDVGSTSLRRAFGLNIMKERANLIGAILDINSIPGEGTTITLLRRNKEDK
jgi:signal transduction histidine kinase